LSTFAALQGAGISQHDSKSARRFYEVVLQPRSIDFNDFLRLILGSPFCGGRIHRSRLPASASCAPGTVVGGQTTATGRRRTGLSVTTAPAGETMDFAGIVQSRVSERNPPRHPVATADFLDVTFFLILGAVVAASFNTVVKQEVHPALREHHTPVAIASLMILRSLLSICSTTDAFIMATFRTFPFAAKLAALVFGPLFDSAVWLYSLIFKTRAVIVLGIGLFIVIGLVCGDSLRFATRPHSL